MCLFPAQPIQCIREDDINESAGRQTSDFRHAWTVEGEATRRISNVARDRPAAVLGELDAGSLLRF